jgi:hypothetical protein
MRLYPFAPQVPGFPGEAGARPAFITKVVVLSAPIMIEKPEVLFGGRPLKALNVAILVFPV